MYKATYNESSNNTPVTLRLDAQNDHEAKIEVRKIVADGFRNKSFASVTLSDGTVYSARNSHGSAVGRTA